MINETKNPNTDTTAETLNWLGFGDRVMRMDRKTEEGGEPSVVMDLPTEAMPDACNVFPVLQEKTDKQPLILGYGGTASVADLVKMPGTSPLSPAEAAEAVVRGMGMADNQELLTQFTAQLTKEAQKPPVQLPQIASNAA